MLRRQYLVVLSSFYIEKIKRGSVLKMIRPILAECYNEVLRESLAETVGKLLKKAQDSSMDMQQLTDAVASSFNIDNDTANKIVTTCLKAYGEKTK